MISDGYISFQPIQPMWAPEATEGGAGSGAPFRFPLRRTGSTWT